MDEQLKRELATIQAFEMKYGTDEFTIMDSIMERNGHYGNWSDEVVGNYNWKNIEKIANEICSIIDNFIESGKISKVKKI